MRSSSVMRQRLLNKAGNSKVSEKHDSHLNNKTRAQNTLPDRLAWLHYGEHGMRNKTCCMMPKRKKREIRSFSKAVKCHSQCLKDDVSDESTSSPENNNDSDTIWVQCENKKCLKWRKITSEELEKVGDGSWYCVMNKDPMLNKCSAPERKEKLPKHLKYVYSLLPNAEIVMARIPGYPSWPGMLTPDPTCGEYYDALLDKQDEPLQYHVEFLGNPHSRAWVRPRMVHPYHAITEEEKLIPLEKGSSKLLMSYRTALEEAKYLATISASERLKRSCQFKYKIARTPDQTRVEEPVKKSKLSQEKNKGVCLIKTEQLSDFDQLSSAEEDQPESPSLSKSSVCHYFTRCERKKKEYITKKIKGHNLDPAEKDFIHSLKLVLGQKGLPPPRHPKWRGNHISLLSFYTVVQQQGGFETVCKSKSWSKIYNNLVKPNGKIRNGGLGNVARLFYQRHLLPYEVHIKSLQPTDVCSVPSIDTDTKPAVTPLDKRIRTPSTSTLASDGEQKVPDGMICLGTDRSIESPLDSTSSETSDAPTPQDCVPSSNPDTPTSHHYSGMTSDSEDEEDDIGIDCRSAEYELQQLERLLSSIEPSLYPPQAQETLDKRSTLSGHVDVLNTLDEMSRIEGTIADLDTMVSLELENL